ncbi:peptidase inhibitor family I36 protein [Streptomyces sp. NPDC001985]|uniref:peptidase inhibitor family I36 protein n=1 Tax=Streptomyces sp. NPDC001985 TaxID=3154406 RepID=UPI0033197A6C
MAGEPDGHPWPVEALDTRGSGLIGIREGENTVNWMKRSAAVLSVLAVAGAGMLVTAPSAAAAGDCAPNRLCVWDGVNFSGTKITSASTNACFRPISTPGFSEVRSYSNGLSVDAKIYEWNGLMDNWIIKGLPSGGFSSDIVVPRGGGNLDRVCMGSATP